MEPTLLVGDRIFVSKFTYGYSKHSFPFSPNFSNSRFFSREPKQGDLVVFKTPSDNRTDYIKRVIGLPNDKVDIRNQTVYVNDVIQPRGMTLTSPKMGFPIEIPENCIFVLGDNRINSQDSRYVGTIPISNIIGKAIYLIYPFENFKKLDD